MRFRLLSYVVGILLLSGLLGLNLTMWLMHPSESTPEEARDFLGVGCIAQYGWPFAAVSSLSPAEGSFYWRDLSSEPPKLIRLPGNSVYIWHWPALIADTVIGLAIPIAGLLACEFVLRRYASRRKVE